MKATQLTIIMFVSLSYASCAAVLSFTKLASTLSINDTTLRRVLMRLLEVPIPSTDNGSLKKESIRYLLEDMNQRG